MRISAISTTQEILREIGTRLRAFRLQQNQTAAQLARQAGLGVRTITRVESGENASVESLVQLLRALGRLEALDAFLPEPLTSPLQLAAGLKVHARQRASAPRVRRGPRGG